MTYKLINNDEGNLDTIKFTDDNGKIKFIPLDEANKDYQKYLEWVANGGQVEEAE